MTKLQFLLALHENLKGLPKEDVEERLSFYSEMIEDRMEEGLTEEDAVAAVGTVGEIAAQITEQAPKKSQKRRFTAWEIVLLAVGSPVWLSLLIAVFAVALSLYICLWAVIVSLWAVFASLAASAFAFLLACPVLLFNKQVPAGMILLAASVALAGLAIFFFCGSKAATIGIIQLTRKFTRRHFYA